jgi:hypothetical protein
MSIRQQALLHLRKILKADEKTPCTCPGNRSRCEAIKSARTWVNEMAERKERKRLKAMQDKRMIQPDSEYIKTRSMAGRIVRVIERG